MVSSPTLITFKRAGVYAVALSVDFASNATGYRFAQIFKVNYDGSVSAGSSSQNAVTGDKTRMHVATHLKVDTAGQQIKAQVLQNSGGALNLTCDFDTIGFAPDLMVALIAGHPYDRSA